MNNEVRTVLTDLVTQHGLDLVQENIRVKALLRDLCPRDRQEVTVLVHAMEAGIPSDLLRQKHTTPINLLLLHLADRLYDQYGTDRELARWAVASWAVELGVASSVMLGLSKQPDKRARAAVNLLGHSETSAVQNPSRNIQRNGKAEGMTLTGGHRYFVPLVNGRFHGTGILVFSDGNRYEGKFRQGKKCGYGTFFFANGERYKGEFRNDTYNGRGTLTFPTGETHRGVWMNGTLVKAK